MKKNLSCHVLSHRSFSNVSEGHHACRWLIGDCRIASFIFSAKLKHQNAVYCVIYVERRLFFDPQSGHPKHLIQAANIVWSSGKTLGVLNCHYDMIASFSASGNTTLKWNLRYHWLKGLQQSQIDVVIQTPGSWYGSRPHLTEYHYRSQDATTWAITTTSHGRHGYSNHRQFEYTFFQQFVQFSNRENSEAVYHQTQCYCLIVRWILRSSADSRHKGPEMQKRRFHAITSAHHQVISYRSLSTFRTHFQIYTNDYNNWFT